MAVTARINLPGTQKVSVTVPSASLKKLTSLTDVNATTLEDGSILQYDATSEKFVTRTDIKTERGTLKLNGGNF